MTDTMTKDSHCCQTPVAERSQESTTYGPRFDILETDNELLLYGDLPGVLPEDLDLRFENRELSVHAKVTPRHASGTAICSEYGIGDYHRSFSVADTIDADAISAELTNGVPTLHLPKIEAVKPRRIKVKA